MWWFLLFFSVAAREQGPGGGFYTILVQIGDIRRKLGVGDASSAIFLMPPAFLKLPNSQFCLSGNAYHPYQCKKCTSQIFSWGKAKSLLLIWTWFALLLAPADPVQPAAISLTACQLKRRTHSLLSSNHSSPVFRLYWAFTSLSGAPGRLPKHLGAILTGRRDSMSSVHCSSGKPKQDHIVALGFCLSPFCVFVAVGFVCQSCLFQSLWTLYAS